MSFRPLSRAGIGLGARLVGKNKNVVKVTHVAGAERNISSWVGLGQDHFRRPYTSRPGSLGTGTQLFKLVETDLMSRELTRYGPSDAEHLGLYSVQDVLSDIAHATSSPSNPENTVHTSSVAPPLKTASNVAAPQEDPMSSEAAAARGEKVLAAWGMGQGRVEVVEDVKAEEEAEESVSEGTGTVHEKLAIKRTYQPSTLKRKRMHGFLYRAKTRLGKKIMRRRQEKGRWRLGI